MAPAWATGATEGMVSFVVQHGAGTFPSNARPILGDTLMQGSALMHALTRFRVLGQGEYNKRFVCLIDPPPPRNKINGKGIKKVCFDFYFVFVLVSCFRREPLFPIMT